MPRFISVRSLVAVWLMLLGMLLIILTLAFVIDIPVYASGTTVSVQRSEGEVSAVTAILPAGALESLREGQRLVLSAPTSGERAEAFTTRVERQTLDPDAVRLRFGSDNPATVDQPSVVVVARIEEPDKLPRGEESYRADVQVESRSLASLVTGGGE